jgi:hypothetical protein
MVNSGGTGADDADHDEFVRHIKAEIQSLADEIADLATARSDGRDVGEVDRLIAVHRRTIRRLRVHLPSIPTGT